MIIAGAAVGNCSAIDLDFDGSWKSAFSTLSENPVMVPAVSEPVPERHSRGINEPIDYYMTLDSNSYWFMSEAAANLEGNVTVDHLRAAGYVIVGARANLNWMGCRPNESCSKAWSFDVSYAAPAGQIAWKVQRYYFNYDTNGSWYTSETDLKSVSKLTESKFIEAGYAILQNRIIRQAPLTTGNPATWDCQIEYVAPVGSIPGDTQWFTLRTDQQGNLYGGPQGRIQAIAAGKIVADNLRAAGNIILEEYPIQFDTYNHKWEYDIRYIARIK